MEHFHPLQLTVTSPKDFDRTAGILLNGCILVARSAIDTSPQYYRLTDIEFFLYNPQHPDPYCDSAHGVEAKTTITEHRHLSNGRWYCHQALRPDGILSSTYKTGREKGLDYTLGDGKASYCGVYIRGLYDLIDHKAIEGPIEVMNTLMCATSKIEIRDFDQYINNQSNSNRGLTLYGGKILMDPVYACQRENLDPRYGAWYVEAEHYKGLPYRYVVDLSQS